MEIPLHHQLSKITRRTLRYQALYSLRVVSQVILFKVIREHSLSKSPLNPKNEEIRAFLLNCEVIQADWPLWVACLVLILIFSFRKAIIENKLLKELLSIEYEFLNELHLFTQVLYYVLPV